MTRESYEKITGILRGHPRRIRLVCLLNHTLTGFIFVLYPAFLLLLFLEGAHFFPRALLVPAVSLPQSRSSDGSLTPQDLMRSSAFRLP